MNIKPNLLEDKSSLLDSSSVLLRDNRFKKPKESLVSTEKRILLLTDLNILTSKKSDEYNFTNFLNKECINDFDTTLYNLLCDVKNKVFLKNLKFDLDENIDLINFEEKNRLCGILNLYRDENNYIKEESLSEITKAKIRTALGNSTSFRIYINISSYDYKIILLDPLHLAMLSKIQYRKGHRYIDHKSNDLCITCHLILKDFELKRIYSELKNIWDK